MSRHFPAPWREERFSGAYVVRDAAGQALACQIASNSDPFRFQFRPPTERVDLST